MKQALFLGFLAYGLLLVGLATLRHEIMVLAVPLLVYLGVALTRASGALQLQCQRQLSHRSVSEGSQVQVTLTVTNGGREEVPASIEQFLVSEQLPARLAVDEGETQALAALPPGAGLRLAYSLSSRRGVYEFPDVSITAYEPLGLFGRTVRVAAPAQLTVLPAFRRLPRIAIRPLRTLGFTGPIPSRQSGAGIDFFGVREYQPGDPLRRVNWRATARYTHTPFTTEFEQERTGDVGLILDMRRQTALAMGGESLLEHSVGAAAALADALLGDGHRVGLLLYGYGLNWVFPGYGRRQRERILQALATAEPVDSQVFRSLSFLPTRLFPARSQLVFVSPLVAGDERMLFRLRAHGYAVLVVSPDPVTFEAGRLPPSPLLSLAERLARLERRLFLQRLRQGGVGIVDWPVDRPLSDVLPAASRQAARTSHITRRVG